MLDLQQLRYFVAVAETESIARAAERLHVSQSPLSRQVIALEAKLGVALFTRERQRLRLTAAGHTLLADARDLLERARRVEQSLRPVPTPDLVIGYVEGALLSGALPSALRAVRRLAPGLRVVLRPMRSDEQVAALATGDIHLGFAHRAMDRTAPVADEPFLLAMDDEHPLADATLSAGRLDGAGFIGVSAGVSPRGHAEFAKACADAGFRPRLDAEAAAPSAALALAAAGAGIAVVQASATAVAPANVVFRPMPPGFTQRMRVHRLVPRRRTHPLVPALRAA
jgi:DNA-binding transcriptional LysR family regulator